MKSGAVGEGGRPRVAAIESIGKALDPSKPDLQVVLALLAHLRASIVGNEAVPRMASIIGPLGDDDGEIGRHPTSHGVCAKPNRRGVDLFGLGAPTNMSEARVDYDLARESRQRAQEEVHAAIRSGDPRRIRAAQARLREAEAAEAQALTTYRRITEETEVDKRRRAKEFGDRIAKALQVLLAEQRRLADSASRSVHTVQRPSETHAADTLDVPPSGAERRLLNADSEVRMALFQLVNRLRNAD